MIRKFLLCLMLTLLSSAEARSQVTLMSSTLEEKDARAGDEYTGVIRLRNDSAEPQEVKLYQTDYSFYADGTTNYDAAASQPRSNARWIAISPARLVVPPHGEAIAKYTVTVPSDSKSGSYWSMIMAEGIATGSAESASPNSAAKPQVGVQTSVRYGIQIVTHMPGAAARDARLENTAIRANDNGRTLEFDLVNTGEVAFRPKLIAQVFDASGKQVEEFAADRGLVYPASSVRQRFELPAKLKGEHRVVLIADTGGDDLQGAQFRATF